MPVRFAKFQILLPSEIWKIQDLDAKILKVQDLACKFWNFPDLAGKSSKNLRLYGNI